VCFDLPEVVGEEQQQRRDGGKRGQFSVGVYTYLNLERIYSGFSF